MEGGPTLDVLTSDVPSSDVPTSDVSTTSEESSRRADTPTSDVSAASERSTRRADTSTSNASTTDDKSLSHSTKESVEDSDKSGVSTKTTDTILRSVHSPSDSILTSRRYANYRGLVNLGMLLLFLSSGRLAAENLLKYGLLVSPTEWISIVLQESWSNVALIALSNLSILAALHLEKFLAVNRPKSANYIAFVCYATLLFVHLTLPPLVILRVRSNPLLSVLALTIYVIEALKIVSWAHVNYWCRVGRITPSCSSAVNYPDNLTTSNIYYFMLVPTLCYELEFPRSPKRHWRFIARCTAELILLSFLVAALSQQWVVPILRNAVGRYTTLDYLRMTERVSKLAVPNVIIWLVSFYIIFQSFFNLMAELLLFADRTFYLDFWNAQTIPHFWRTWNVPVHRWAVRHAYFPAVRLGCSKWTASMFVFLLSAVLHEYLVSIPLNIASLYAFLGMLAQLPLAHLTKDVVKGGVLGNLLVWLSLVLGQPASVVMYVHDWYNSAYPSNSSSTLALVPVPQPMNQLHIEF